MYPAANPDPTPDPTPFFSDIKDGKKLFFIFFSYNLRAGTLSSVLKIEFFILQALFNAAQHHYEKGERSGAGSGAGSVPLTNGSGSPTLCEVELTCGLSGSVQDLAHGVAEATAGAARHQAPGNSARNRTHEAPLNTAPSAHAQQVVCFLQSRS
jgi:hypothetical protein